MKLIKTSAGWIGKMNPEKPEEAETIDIMGTDLIPLPFTEKATEEQVRAFYSQEEVNGLPSVLFKVE